VKLTRHSLQNPPIVAVIAAVIVLFGIVTLFKLPVQLLPNVEKPYITVWTQWRGAAPTEVESEITDQIEEVLQGIPGLEEMISNSSAGLSFVNMRFSLESDQTRNLVEVISRMNRLRPLPADADPPQVVLGNLGDDAEALMWFFVQIMPSADLSPIQLYEYFDNVIIPQFEAIGGVTGSNFYSTFGAGEQLQIIIDPYKVAALGIDLTDVAIRAGRSTDVSGGFLDVGRNQFTLRFRGKFDATNLENLVVGFVNDQPISLSEVARVRVGPGRPDGLIYQNGHPAFALQLLKDKNTNVLATLKEVKAQADELNATLLHGAGLHMERSYDPSVFINRAINLLTGNLGLGLLLAMGVLWVFLRHVRATAIITLSVPISLTTAIIVFGFMGRTINVISLAGLAFATGMVMDAAIVVMENIVRLREKGLGKEEACERGTGQVWGALLASTATTVIIFIPVMFLSDVEGQLFTDLALTIALSVSISLLTAVTILPTLAARWMKHLPAKDVHGRFWDAFADRLMALTNTPAKRFKWIAGLLAVPALLTVLLIPTMDYLPNLKDERVDAFFLTPPGISHDTMDREIAQPFIARLAPYLAGEKEPKLKNYYFAAFGGGAFVFSGARAADEDRVEELEALMRDEFTAGFPDTMAFVQRANLFGGFSSSGSIEIHMQSADAEALNRAAIAGMDMLVNRFQGANVNPEPNPFSSSPEVQIVPNDRRITEVGWTRRNVGAIVQILGDGLWLGEHFDGERRLDIMLKAETSPDPETLLATPVYTPRAGVVPVGNFAAFEPAAGPQQIRRLDGRRTTTLVFNPPEGVALEQSLEILKAEVEPQLRALLPADGAIRYGGSADDLGRAIATLGGNFLLAFFLLFLIMAALFRSVKDSFLVIISIPLGTVGGVAMLRLLNLFTFQPMDLLAMIGFIILLGLVVNNAILLVARTRQGLAEGRTLTEATREALRLRLRPIFMTTGTTILGMLPLLLFPGEGSVIYRGMAAVIVGGMTVSTLFTLILLPCLLQAAGAAELNWKALSRAVQGLKKPRAAE